MTRPATNPTAPAKKAQNLQATRETVESIVIAVILAFLFRGFVAEAFVIPTGSMASTLMGRHMDVRCPNCDYSYQTGASEENDGHGRVHVTHCPICRFPKKLNREKDPNEGSFNGDRILVSKYEYELGDPNRWDVIVFKFPQNAKQNYIKRLIGLPNELVRIQHGDIYIGRHLLDFDREQLEGLIQRGDTTELLTFLEQHVDQLSPNAVIERIRENEIHTVLAQRPEAMWSIYDSATGRDLLIRLPPDGKAQLFSAPTIARKPPKKERALLQIVHDTNYQGTLLLQANWPSRWQDRGDNPVWREEDPGSYVAEANDSEFGWLRYRHIYPSEDEWRQIVRTKRRPAVIERADGALISDYYAYNDRISTESRRMTGHHWVGDLAVEAEVDIRSATGELAFDLVEAGVHYQCTIDVANGRARLKISDGTPFVGEEGGTSSPTAEAETDVRGQGRYTIRFVNADNQLRLWVDGDVVSFNEPTTFEPTGENIPQWSEADPGDLAPIGVGARGAVVRVDRLKVFRDVYYVAVTGAGSDYSRIPSENEIQDVFRSPKKWPRSEYFRDRRTVEFVMGEHQFFPLGDNSPQSADGRMWDDEPYFTDDMLIGKAMLIYWPHGWWTPVPYTPNFSRMRLIH